MAGPRELDAPPGARREPLLLALETATRSQSVAVGRGGETRIELVDDGTRGGAESLLPLVDAALRRAGVALADVEAFAVSIGPGSFTGLRIGLATVKGLAFGSDRPVAPVCTLAALAATAAAQGVAGIVAPILDARRGELYGAAYAPHAGGGWRECVRPAVYTPDAFARALPGSCTLVGEGVAQLGAAVRAAAGSGVALGPEGPPRAAAVARLGARVLREGGGCAAAALAPRYLRRAEAEVKRTGLRFEPDVPGSGPGST